MASQQPTGRTSGRVNAISSNISSTNQHVLLSGRSTGGGSNEGGLFDCSGSSLLAQFLAGKLASPLLPATASLIWAECFSWDTVEYISPLPQFKLTWELMFLHSYRMKRTVAEFPMLGIVDGSITGLSLRLRAMSMLEETVVMIAHITQDPLTKAGELFHSHLQRIYGKIPTDLPAQRLLLITAAGLGILESVSAVLETCTDQPAIWAAVDLAVTNYHSAVADKLQSSAQISEFTLMSAIRAGRIGIMRCICRAQPDTLSKLEIQDVVSLANRNRLIVWLLQNSALLKNWQDEPIVTACMRLDNLELLKYVHANKIGMRPESSDVAIAARTMPIIIWAFTSLNYLKWGSLLMMDLAATDGNACLVGFLLERKFKCSNEGCRAAITGNHLDVVKLLRAHDPDLNWAMLESYAQKVGCRAIESWLNQQNTKDLRSKALSSRIGILNGGRPHTKPPISRIDKGGYST
ncbi:hypothetical protein BASA62_006522 [Batrachochytrium salamandrivorans]|nr:hypothetical protein BASA62_006522 [Batrachochytrium salamandrivorans]